MDACKRHVCRVKALKYGKQSLCRNSRIASPYHNPHEKSVVNCAQSGSRRTKSSLRYATRHPKEELHSKAMDQDRLRFPLSFSSPYLQFQTSPRSADLTQRATKKKLNMGQEQTSGGTPTGGCAKLLLLKTALPPPFRKPSARLVNLHTSYHCMVFDQCFRLLALPHLFRRPSASLPRTQWEAHAI